MHEIYICINGFIHLTNNIVTNQMNICEETQMDVREETNQNYDIPMDICEETNQYICEEMQTVVIPMDVCT